MLAGPAVAVRAQSNNSSLDFTIPIRAESLSTIQVCPCDRHQFSARVNEADRARYPRFYSGIMAR